jgi:hypothetical protein
VNSRSRRRGDVTVDSPQPAVTGQAVDEPVCPVPLPGEPASHLSFGRDYGGADRGGDELVQGLARIGVAGARDGVGLVPADQLAGMLVPFTGGDLQRAGNDRTAAFQRGAQRVQLLPLEPQLGAQVIDAGRPGVGEMIEQAPPAGAGGACG